VRVVNETTKERKMWNKSIFNRLLKFICHILSFGNLVKDLASEKNDYLQ
jgi:hypothetical protein